MGGVNQYCIIASGNGFILFGKGVLMDGMDSVLDFVCTRIIIDRSKSRNCSSCHDWYVTTASVGP